MAEEKKLPRHKRLYKDSPKLERGEDGSMAASRKNDKRGDKPSDSEKDADKAQSNIEGKQDTTPEEDARIQEIKDMHTRHQKEMESIHKRHEKEDVKKYAKEQHDTDDNEKAGAGKKEIKEVEEDKKNTE